MQDMMIAYKYPIPRKRLVSTNLYVLESRYILSVFSWLFLLLKLSGYLWTVIRRQKTLKRYDVKRHQKRSKLDWDMKLCCFQRYFCNLQFSNPQGIESLKGPYDLWQFRSLTSQMLRSTCIHVYKFVLTKIVLLVTRQVALIKLAMTFLLHLFPGIGAWGVKKRGSTIRPVARETCGVNAPQIILVSPKILLCPETFLLKYIIKTKILPPKT